MGNFLVVVPTETAAPEGKQLFFGALEASEHLGWQRPSAIVENDWAFAAAFPRHNGSGGKIATDRAAGSWILASGAWFHQDSFASGAESALLQRFLEVGALQLARELEGFFVVVIGDGRRREIVAITDVIGSRHCFERSHKAGTLLSGSSLLLASAADSTLDYIGSQEFLNTGIVFEDRTCHREVKKIGPATVLRLSASSQSRQQYWNPVDAIARQTSGNQAIEAVWHSLSQAANRIQRLYPNSVCDLTGGYDSRVVVAALLGAGAKCATTVSGPAGCPDVEISAGLANALGLRHLQQSENEPVSLDALKRCVTLTDGEYDLLKYAQIRSDHSQLASRFDASINGSFGEVARGYWWELLFPALGARKPLDAVQLARRRYAAQPFDPLLVRPEARVDLAAHLAEMVRRTNLGLDGLPNTFQMDNTYLKMRMQRWQGRIASSTNQIWPCVSPFMFRSVLEGMLSAAPMLRWRSLLVRKMLGRFSPQAAAYPLEHGFPAEPASLKNLHRFAPLVPYFGRKFLMAAYPAAAKRKHRPDNSGPFHRGDLWKHERIRELLNPSEMKAGVLLEPVALSSFLEKSRQEPFAFGDQWARLLTLEWGLRVAESARIVSTRASLRAVKQV